MLIREKDKKKLLQIFSSINLPVEVWAYGSRVNGSAHEGSDLDLVIRSNDLSTLPANAFAYLYEQIKESDIPILVELSDWSLLPKSFHKNIEQQYEVLFDSCKNFSSTEQIHMLNESPAAYKTKPGEDKKDIPG
jgi:predicted nucleotidyltransferase